MTVALVYDPTLAAYRFGAGHPLKPERFTLAIGLMRAWGHLSEEGGAAERGAQGAGRPVATLVRPKAAGDDEILAVHTPGLLAAVKAAGANPQDADGRFGIGPGDTPAFERMHEAGARVVGATITALDAVLAGSATRAFSPAGGMHHAHADRCAGFCIYNDPAIAIERATRLHPGVRVAYVDIDAHHGDGVEEAFHARADVLTLSVHQSGRYLYPGTGFVSDIGDGPGAGCALNVPLPPFSGPRVYSMVHEEVVAPALRAFRPDVIVLQGGADSHRSDPLTQLDNTVAGFSEMVGQVVAAADAVCDGRLVMLGGGGYATFSAVPRMWACAMARLLGVAIPESLPRAWLDEARLAAAAAGDPEGAPQDASTWAEPAPGPDEAVVERTFDDARAVIAELRATHPLLRG